MCQYLDDTLDADEFAEEDEDNYDIPLTQNVHRESYLKYKPGNEAEEDEREEEEWEEEAWEEEDEDDGEGEEEVDEVYEGEDEANGEQDADGNENENDCDTR